MAYPAGITPFFWYSDDPTTLFTDTARTTPVANDADAIAGVTDQGPNGYHLTQSTAASRWKWDAINRTIQSEYEKLEAMNLPTVPSVSGQACTIVFIGELVTTRDGNASNSNYVDQYFLDGNADGFALSYHRGGLLQTWDGANVRQNTTLRPHTARSMIAFACGSGSTTAYVDGTNASLTLIRPASAFTGGQLGNNNAGTRAIQASIRDIIGYNSQLSSGQMASLLAYAQSRGSIATVTGHLGFAGDSISAGLGCTMNRNWVRQIPYSSTTKRTNFSESALQISTSVTEDATIVDPWLVAGVTNVLSVFLGTNDMAIGNSAATAYSNLQTWCTARKAAGWNKIVVGTCLARGDVNIEAKRQTFNASIRSGFAGSTLACDAVADVGNDAIIGQANSYTNTTYFAADQVHPTNAGETIIASYFQPLIYSLLPSAVPAPSGGGSMGINQMMQLFKMW